MLDTACENHRQKENEARLSVVVVNEDRNAGPPICAAHQVLMAIAPGIGRVTKGLKTSEVKAEKKFGTVATSSELSGHLADSA